MTDAAKMKVTMEKKRLLSDFERLHQMMGDYEQMLASGEVGSPWHDEAVRVLRSQRISLYQARISMSTVELVCALLRQILAAIPVEQFNFRMPGAESRAVPEKKSPHPQDDVADLPPSPDKMIAWLTWLSRTAPMETQEKIRLVFAGLKEFFARVSEGDREGIDNALNRIHLSTTNEQTKAMVREIALITRDVFEALKIVSDELPLGSLAESSEGISQTVNRLHSVVARLDEATMQNLEDLEQVNKKTTEHGQLLTSVQEALQEAQNRLGALRETRPELGEVLAALEARLGEEAGADVRDLHRQGENNSEIYMELISNQGFHELSARTLKKVITFVEMLEGQLIEILKTFRPGLAKTAIESGDAGRLASLEMEGEAQSQADVDRLLDEMGF